MSRPVRILLAVIVGLTVAASVLAALQWRSYIDTQQARQVETTTQEVRASLAVAIQRDVDLVQTLGGLVTSGTTLTNAHLQALYAQVGGSNTAGVVGVGYIESVPEASLPTFETQVREDPPLGIDETGNPLTNGALRSRYCLVRLAARSRSGANDLSAAGKRTLADRIATQYDYCTSPFAPALAEAAATGTESVTPVDAALIAHPKDGAANAFFQIVMAIPQPGTPPSTLATSSGRERAVLGWAVGLFSASRILDPLVTATPGLSISVRHANATGTTTVATAGTTVAGAVHRIVAVAAGGTWRATVAMTPSASGTAQALGVLTDLLVIVLLGALVVVLMRSRRRAFRSIERKNEELHHRALHDTLTGLPNRDLIVETTEAMLAGAEEEHGGAVAALLIDLDNLTWINSTYGHRVGDSVLVRSARRIEDTLGPGDLLGRLAGDEFVVLTPAAAGSVGPGGLAQRVLDALSEPMRLSEEGLGVAVRITACIGVAVGAGCRGEELLRDADTALTEAKAAGNGRIGRFEPGMHWAARDRLAMTGELRSALEEGQFFLVYQPVFELPGLAPIGVEALVRWRHPLRGVVGPSEFIGLLEDTGMINELGYEVLREACRQGEEWQRRGLDTFVSVNASALELESEGFVAQVARVLEDTGLDPHHLSIELTESALMRDAAGSIRRLANLKSLGIRIAIDDFGTGYSSLAYLRQFPVDIVKIDRSFVVAMTSAPGGMALVRTMLELARALGLHSVAEGIEDRHQLDALISEHCEAGQGFVLSKPLEADQIELFFDNARPRDLLAVFGAR